jgi:hypothetical protein
LVVLVLKDLAEDLVDGPQLSELVVPSLINHPPLVQVLVDDKFPLVLKAEDQHFLFVFEPVGLKDPGLIVVVAPDPEVERDKPSLFLSLFFFLVSVGGDVATENERGRPRLFLVGLVDDRTVATEDERGEPSSFLDSTLVAEVDRGEHGTRGMTRSHGSSEMIVDLDGRTDIDGFAGSPTRFDTRGGSSGGNRIDLSTGTSAGQRTGARGSGSSFGTSTTEGATDPRETIVVPASSRTRRKVRAESSVVVGASARTRSGSRVVVVVGIPGWSAHRGVAAVIVCVLRTGIGAERPVDGSVLAEGRVGGDVGRTKGS